ncbi:hypothetical protein B0J18DRAFT_460573 [Chaetomium sp. MPI-SDFR-AT-0129]|nr:hypothetical protein B0J18DRAFT_460573 [Chaetomium sp. MPI-SDFR-AT-0129]
MATLLPRHGYHAVGSGTDANDDIEMEPTHQPQSTHQPQPTPTPTVFPTPTPSPLPSQPPTHTSPTTPTPTTTTTVLPPYSSFLSGPDANPPLLSNPSLPWRPFYLRRRILAIFAFWFGFVILAVETLQAISQRDTGVAASSPQLHYVWRYGPTAVLTLLAAAWSRAEYQSKLIAPWVNLAKHHHGEGNGNGDGIGNGNGNGHRKGDKAEKTLLLDYLSDFQLWAVFKALKNRDFTVSATATVAILIKALIVISTGLISLTWTDVAKTSWPVTLQDTFADNTAGRLSHTGNLAYYVMQGLADRNITYPDGVHAEYAYQAFASDLLGRTAQATVRVDGFGNGLECEEVDFSVKGAAPPDPHYSDQVMNATVSGAKSGCGIQDLVISPSPTWGCGNNKTCPVVFSRFAKVQCDGPDGGSGNKTTDQNDRKDDRVLVLLANMTYAIDFSQTFKDYTGQGKRHPYLATLHRATALLCTPTYAITKVDVVRNGTVTKSVTPAPESPSFKQTPRMLDSVSPWDIMDAHYTAFANSPSLSLVSNPYGQTTRAGRGDLPADVDAYTALALPTQLLPTEPLTVLFNSTRLARLATRYYAQIGGIIAKQSLMAPASIPATGSVIITDTRLIISPWAAHWMAALAGVCLVLVGGVVVWTVPKEGLLPCSPTTLPGMERLVGGSGGLVGMLRFGGAADREGLARGLRGGWFYSGVVDGGPKGEVKRGSGENKGDDKEGKRPGLGLSARTEYLGSGGESGLGLDSEDSGADKNNNGKFVILKDTSTTPERHHHTFPQIISKAAHPSALHPFSRLALCVLLILLIVALDLMLRKSEADNGLGDVGSGTYLHYSWTAVPAIVFGALSMLFSTIDFQIRSLAPYTELKNGVSAKAYATLDFMDMSIPRTLWREVQFGNVGALSATTAFLVASLFTIFSASLFQPMAVPAVAGVSLRVNQSFDVRQYSTQDGNVLASLVLASNLSFPAWTYDTLAFPQMVPTIDGPLPKYLNTSTMSITAEVPALRSTLSCRLYTPADITLNHTRGYTIEYTEFTNPLGITIAGEGCNTFPQYEEWGYNNILPTYPNMTFFGLGDATSNVSTTQGCSDYLYTWGQLDYHARPSAVKHIVALGCNETFERVSVSATFTSLNLTLDTTTSNPPVLVSNTTSSHQTTISTYPGTSFYSYLAQLTTAPNHLDPFFALLTSSPWSVPLTDLGTPNSTDAVISAIHHHHGLIQAQNLAQRIVPANTTNTTLPLSLLPAGYQPPPRHTSYDTPPNKLPTTPNTDDIPTYHGTATSALGEGPLRVQQDRTSTRILQALLGSAVVLVLTGDEYC